MSTEELRDENGDTYADVMDRICLTCYGQGTYCDACEASTLFCELYNHCTEDEKRHVACDCCDGTGLKASARSASEGPTSPEAVTS